MISNLSKVVIFNSKSGAYVNNLVMPKVSGASIEELEFGRGHTNFAFSEDSIIVFHSRRNFPIAADVLLYW